MSLPTKDQLAAVTQKGAAVLQAELAPFGISIGQDQIAQVLQFAVDAVCMQAWRDIQSAGKAASDAITTEAQAEAAQRQS